MLPRQRSIARTGNKEKTWFWTSSALTNRWTKLLCEANPIVGYGTAISTSGIVEAAYVRYVVGLRLQLSPVRKSYIHSLGSISHGAERTVCSWTILVLNTNNPPTDSTFRLLRRSSPLILMLDKIQYANLINNPLTNQPHIPMIHPTDYKPRIFHTYIFSDEQGSNSSIRRRVHLSAPWDKKACTLLPELSNNAESAPLILSRKIHRFTNAHLHVVGRICWDAGTLSKSMEDAITAVDDWCDVFAWNTSPKPMIRVSPTHVNKHFNEEVQLGFMFHITPGEKRAMLVVTDTGTECT